MSEKKNIIDYFFDTFEKKMDGLKFLNDALDRNYKHNTISEWRNPDNERIPSAKVYEIMIVRVISTYPVNELADKLYLPEKNRSK